MTEIVRVEGKEERRRGEDEEIFFITHKRGEREFERRKKEFSLILALRRKQFSSRGDERRERESREGEKKSPSLPYAHTCPRGREGRGKRREISFSSPSRVQADEKRPRCR